MAGGGVALVRAKQAIANLKGENADQDAGIKIVLRAMEEPLRQIVANSGDEPSVVVNKVAEGKGNFGYNAATHEYGDLVAMGVLDPTKVTRTALQNASSVASLMLTTDCMVAELVEDKPAAGGGMPAAWGHGRHGRDGHVSPRQPGSVLPGCYLHICSKGRPCRPFFHLALSRDSKPPDVTARPRQPLSPRASSTVNVTSHADWQRNSACRRATDPRPAGRAPHRQGWSSTK